MKYFTIINIILLLGLFFSGCGDDKEKSSPKGSCLYYKGSNSSWWTSYCYDNSNSIEECNSECYWGSGKSSCKYSDKNCEDRWDYFK